MICINLLEMKRIINSKAYRLLFGLFSFGLLMNLASCNEDDGDVRFVDLRYNPEDSYLVTAGSPEDVVFEVKSNYPWKIFGKKDWYAVTPASGQPDSIYKVTIAIQENTDLDDRIDTLTIQSDYWVGKRFVLTQKGTAYLTTVKDTFPRESAAGPFTFDISANQDWSCKVTEGDNWLSLTAGAEGTLNGSVTVSMTENKGEERYGEVTIYDRHGMLAKKVVIDQAGVLLVPEVTELRQLYPEEEISFKVNANSTWKISKSEYDIWFDITSGESYEPGVTTVTVHVQANTGVSMRKAEITLESVSDDPDATPVVKTIMLKQAAKPDPDIKEFNGYFPSGEANQGTPVFENGDFICAAGGNTREVINNWSNVNPIIGTHYFRVKEMAANSHPVIFFVFNWNFEVRCHLAPAQGKTDASYTAYNGIAAILDEGENIPLGDIGQPHIMGVSISDAGGENAGKLKVELSLDYGPVFKTWIIATGSGAQATVYLGGAPGYCVWDWVGYTPLMDWN